jgi:four helix bundle protein
MDLAVEAYAITGHFPRTERFRLIDQLTRAAVAVPANVAEGHERGTRKDYANFVSIARGSLAETETYLLLAERLGYVSGEELRGAVSLADEVGRMLSTLRGRLSQCGAPSP